MYVRTGSRSPNPAQPNPETQPCPTQPNTGHFRNAFGLSGDTLFSRLTHSHTFTGHFRHAFGLSGEGGRAVAEEALSLEEDLVGEVVGPLRYTPLGLYRQVSTMALAP